jgi:hypothetical protein
MNYIIQYVRKHEKNKNDFTGMAKRTKGRPIGVVVAVKSSNPGNRFTMGWSMCRQTPDRSGKVDKFSKARGVAIAYERAVNGTKAKMPRRVKPVYDNMIERGYVEFGVKEPARTTDAG